MKRIQTVIACLALTASAASAAWSTPSTLVFIPSTDVQAPGTWHFGLDTYFTFDAKGTGNVVVTGLTYGLPGRIEIGIDHVGGENDPILGNAKWQFMTEQANAPAISVGAYNFGGGGNALAGNLLYVLASKTFGETGRFHLGYQRGQRSRVGRDNNMLLLAWDKQITPKLWAAVDYASGDSGFGAVSPGVAWSFAENTSVLFGYSFYNQRALDNTITVQVDINF